MENQPLTKKDLEESLESFAGIVNAGFQGVQDTFKEVRDEIRAVDAKVDAKIDALKIEFIAIMEDKINASKTELEEKINASKTELLDSNDAIAKLITDNQQEQAAITGGHQRIDDTLLEHGDTLKEHDARIGGLEAAQSGA